MNRIRRLVSFVLGLSLAAGTGSAAADTVLFDFDSLGAGVNSTIAADAIELYMEGLWGSDITVHPGARTLKNRPEAPHPAGLYLGNSNGAPDRGPFPTPPFSHPDPKDTYLINRWQNGFDRIVIIFEDEPIDAVEFDWEIFPVNGDNTNADFTFKADGVQYYYSNLPTLGEKEQGDLGHFSVTLPSPVSQLEFIDWTDAPVGIDNLQVTQVPGPAPWLALTLGLAGLLARRTVRRRGLV